MATPPYRRSSVFKNGRLIDFTNYAVTVMRPWPDPRAWRKTSRGSWYPCRPGVVLMDEHPPECEPTPEQCFMACAPERVRAIVSMYGERQWHMLSLLARCSGSGDLAESNPALAFALASSWVFRETPVQRPLRAVRHLVGKRQAAILGWLGFPATESTRRILRKVAPDSISIEALLYLRDGLKDAKALQYLRHLPAINRGVIYVVTHAELRSRVTPQFMAELGQIRQAWPILRLHPSLDWALQLKELVQETGTRGQRRGAELPVLRSLEDLKNLRMQSDMERTAWTNRPKFPPPPIPETDNISAIRSAGHLFQESAEMHHCISSYAWDIARGNAYAYRLHEPERATVLIVRQGMSWTIQDIRTAANGWPGEGARRLVEAWLHGRPEESASEEELKCPKELMC